MSVAAAHNHIVQSSRSVARDWIICDPAASTQGDSYTQPYLLFR